MTERFYQIESTGLAGLASLASGRVRAAIGWLPLVVVVGIGHI
jgi:hypothetical protein